MPPALISLFSDKLYTPNDNISDEDVSFLTTELVEWYFLAW